MYSGNNSNRGSDRGIQFSFLRTAHCFVCFFSIFFILSFFHFQNQSELLIGERRSCMIWWYTFTWIKRSICRLWNEISLSESAVETINIWSLFLVFTCKENEIVMFFFSLLLLLCNVCFYSHSFRLPSLFLLLIHSLTLALCVWVFACLLFHSLCASLICVNVLVVFIFFSLMDFGIHMNGQERRQPWQSLVLCAA